MPSTDDSTRICCSAMRRTECRAGATLRPGKDFQWFTHVFQEMIAMNNQAGWYKRAQLYNLVFLQQSDGGFRPTQELANTLRAGKPKTSVEDSPFIEYDLEELTSTTPKALLQCFQRGHSHIGHEWTQRVWATLLARALHEQLPFSWIMNPQDAPREQTSIADSIDTWLESGRNRAMKLVLPDMRSAAERVVQEWNDLHVQRIGELKERLEPLQVGISKVQLPWWQRTASQAFQAVGFVISSHPLVAIYLVKPTEAFSRSERLIVQVNVFIIMLGCCMGFYYSRVVQCCVDLQGYVGCPEPSRNAACIGYTSCGDFLGASNNDFLPSESHASDFECKAFPEATWMGRIWSALVMNAVLIPINVTLMALFGLSGASAGRPGHLKMLLANQAAMLLGPQRGQALSNFLLLVYAIFFDFKLITKMMAMAFMAAFAEVLKPVKRVTHVIQYALRGFMPYLLVMTMWFMQIEERAMRWFWGHIMRVPKLRSSQVQVGGEQYFWADPVQRHKIYLEGMFETLVDRLAYSLLASMWGMTIWVLLAYGTKIREIMGPDAEKELITTWVMAWFVEQFGLKAVRVVIIRAAGRWWARNKRRVQDGDSGEASVIDWYEGYLMDFPVQYLPDDGDEFFQGIVL
ncbi:hypothetical protein CYMTET_28381 [Cymbomonas tetramitiformis]|uniref:Uncharacterized protein n=1 Tax=Cymbomonas tetramitiformis TaxID=36881 RepID=A0AAE0FN34_9CHLO|nr:hypothetical protein CYMTET_28381 [Cymbomonas tetramitiformis]